MIVSSGMLFLSREDTMIRRALLSVSDTTGLAEFAVSLTAMGVELLSTGGTREVLRKARIPATEVSNYTNFPEIMGGRVKTLHPKIFGGILGRSGEDEEIMQELDILQIDLVVVNLYPFQTVVSKRGCTQNEATEAIDIGGVALLRAAAKNYVRVGVVVHPRDYRHIIAEMRHCGGSISPELRLELAAKAFQHTMSYDQNIHRYLSGLLRELIDARRKPV